MNKWYGNIGFNDTVEYAPGSWEPGIVDRPYYGDIQNTRWKRENSGGINDDINLSTQISIVADPYAVQHCYEIAYVEYLGEKWKVTDVEIQYPRLNLSIGGIWNG